MPRREFVDLVDDGILRRSSGDAAPIGSASPLRPLSHSCRWSRWPDRQRQWQSK
jgi:hypothetical protein